MAKIYRIDTPEPERARASSGNPLLWALVGGSGVLVVMAGVLYFALRSKAPPGPPAGASSPAQLAQAKVSASSGHQAPQLAAPHPGAVLPQAAYPRPRAATPPVQGFGQPRPGAPPHSFPTPRTGFGSGQVTPPPPAQQQPQTAGFGAPAQSAAGAPSPGVSPPAGPSPQDVIARTHGSVLLILTETNSGLASGTGFVVSPRQVATCEHVISDARAIYVFTIDGRRMTASVGAADARNDVAVLNVNGSLPPPLSLGSYGQVRTGDDVAVTGYPEMFTMQAVGFTPTPTTTKGSVSGKRQQMVGGGPIAVIQTDAAVNPGNSGGPLYSLRDGTVVGIAASQIRDTQGLNFASSIDSLYRLLGR